MKTTFNRTDLQAAYQRLAQRQGSPYSDRREDATPDGRYRAEVGYCGGGCGESSYGWVRVQEEGRQEPVYYRKEERRDYRQVAIAPDASVVYVEEASQGKTRLVELPVRAGFLRTLRGPRNLAEIEGSTWGSAGLDVSPDGKKVAFADRDRVQVYDRSRGFLRRFFRSTPDPATTTLPETIADLEFLPDGSLLVAPESYHRRVYLVRPGDPQVQRVPLRDLDDRAYRREVSSRLRGAPDWFVEQVLAEGRTLTDDEGQVPPHALTCTETQAAFVQADQGQASVKVWDRGAAVPRELARLPAWLASTAIAYTPDRSSLIVSQFGKSGAGAVSILGVDSSVRILLPDVPNREAVSSSPDGRALAVVQKGGQSLAIWRQASDVVQEIPLSHDGQGRSEWAQLWWTPDGRQVVVAERPSSQRPGWNLLVVDVEGGGRTFIGDVRPACDSYRNQVPFFHHDRLCFQVGDRSVEVRVPQDLQDLPSQPWYREHLSRALFGQAAESREPGTIEAGEERVVIGGVPLPVKQG
jgi:Tol biopolymer transport system component